MEKRYKIYPSLLDKFQKYLDAEVEADDFWNLDRETGEQKRTAEEIADQHECELIDSINRVPRTPIEAADKGTAFNEVVDCIIENRKQSSNPALTITTEYNVEKGAVDLYGVEIPRVPIAIKAEMNGFTFLYDVPLCVELAKYFKGAICQYFANAMIATAYGDVELYGYIDEWVKDKIYDIKTTGSYDFGKFAQSWQKEVYPYCVIESGEAETISEFEYTVVVLSKPSGRTPVMTGKIYKEVYTYNHEKTTIKLRNIVERFIEWLENHRSMITDKRIFGGENPEGYVGVSCKQVDSNSDDTAN